MYLKWIIFNDNKMRSIKLQRVLYWSNFRIKLNVIEIDHPVCTFHEDKQMNEECIRDILLRILNPSYTIINEEYYIVLLN